MYFCGLFIQNEILLRKTFGLRIHKEGRKMLISFLLALIVINTACYFWMGAYFVTTLAASSVLMIFFTNFFRNPKRIFQTDNPYDIVAPADGKIVVIEPVFEHEILHRECLQVSIFMSVTDVHANWYPFEGKVTHYQHQNGRYQAAFLPKSSQENERSSIVVKADVNGQEVLLRQIAGALARRIVTYAYKGKKCHLNEHMGFIKFGSRVDLYFPADSVEMCCKIGDHVKGNQNIIARFKQPEA
ncbi:MAG: phosphatidylserine decarboxylase family protein [Bacteroidales bacterium]|nr:phosphatidylserine decarboxylase family protein [Bacteroidales bacterium]MBO5718066.1 phosphatidylserine decarboxylase family protein [Bacteroidales bacterium]MBO5769538.1 phosphatidylserine decarboxylase family protein [Bacteroidales bacterium]MBO5819027.1 phosphatidylserine decarboxylase family protein [Bacteroidales bacterium]MBO5847485.1 phosphatidylserine decarboxylase family protein [Bacteroidales bacterium]